MFNYLLYASHCFRCWDCKIIKQDLLLCRLTYKEKERYEHCKAKPNGEKEDMQKISMIYLVCVCAKSLQLRPTLCDPMDCSQPGSSVHGILQARILEQVVMPSSRGSSWPRDRAWVSCIASRFCISWSTREASSPSETADDRQCLPDPFKCQRSPAWLLSHSRDFCKFFFKTLHCVAKTKQEPTGPWPSKAEQPSLSLTTVPHCVLWFNQDLKNRNLQLRPKCWVGSAHATRWPECLTFWSSQQWRPLVHKLSLSIKCDSQVAQ